jgi:hypothetical protein
LSAIDVSRSYNTPRRPAGDGSMTDPVQSETNSNSSDNNENSPRGLQHNASEQVFSQRDQVNGSVATLGRIILQDDLHMQLELEMDGASPAADTNGGDDPPSPPSDGDFSSGSTENEATFRASNSSNYRRHRTNDGRLYAGQTGWIITANPDDCHIPLNHLVDRMVSR